MILEGQCDRPGVQIKGVEEEFRRLRDSLVDAVDEPRRKAVCSCAVRLGKVGVSWVGLQRLRL
jgi:hypothetical protein